MTSSKPLSSCISRGPYRNLPYCPKPDRSRGLVLDQVRQLVNAACFAESESRPLNALLTLRWGDVEGFTSDRWPEAQTKLFDRMARWLSVRGIAPAFVWVRERVPGVGAHTHAIVHLGPQPLAVAAALTAYLGPAGRFRTADGVNLALGRFGAMTPESRAGLQRYVAKGLDHRLWRYRSPDGESENLGAALGLDHRGSQGIITIKRCGVSQSIGPKARAICGWQEVRDVSGLRRLLHPSESTGS